MASDTGNEKSGFSQHESNQAHLPVDTQANDLDLMKTNTTTVEGTTRLYVNGELRCIPMPTADPKGMTFCVLLYPHNLAVFSSNKP